MVRRSELVTNCFYEAKCTTKSKCLCGVALPLLGDLRMATDLAADSRLLHWTLQNLLILFSPRVGFTFVANSSFTTTMRPG